MTKKGKFGARFLSATALATVGISSYATAQVGSPEVDPRSTHSEDTKKLDVVVVTALRREGELQDVPLTVTAISGEQLLNAGTSDIQDIVALTPNAVIQENPESYNTFVSIRGMRVVDVQAEPNVGLYRNGLYMGGHRANLGPQVDVERVEVLRGPQGGLYGRSSVGGTVDMIYATPSREFGGYAKASYGSYNRTEVQGAVNVPVGDASALRLTGWSFTQTESELFNETLNEFVGANSNHGVRLGYAVDLADNLDVLWTVEHREGEGPSMKTFGPFGINNFGVTSPAETADRIRRDTRSEAKSNETYLAQVINYKTDAGDLTLNASYKQYDFGAIQDSDQTAIGPEDFPTARQTDIIRDEGTEGYFLEALWSSPDSERFNWIAGASYFNEKFDFSRIITARRNTPTSGIQTIVIDLPAVGTTVETKSFAVFGSFDLQVTDRLSVLGGLRYSDDKKSLDFAQGIRADSNGNTTVDAYWNIVAAPFYPTLNIKSDGQFENWSPNLTLKYEFTDDLNAYASYSTGFRPGAFNLSPASAELIPYGQETAENFELGMKGIFLDGRLSVDAAAFLMLQDDLLLAQVDFRSDGSSSSYLANVGTSETYGIEFETQFKANDWLTGALSVGWLDPKFDNAVGNAGLPSEQDLSGKLIPYTRKWTANAQINANIPINDAYAFIGTASVRYENGGILGDYYVVDPYDTLTKVDLTAGLEIYGNTRVTAYVRNLLDENISQFWFYNRGTNTSEGKTWGIDVTHRF
jgi:iron complex outermembrane recepter protein